MPERESQNLPASSVRSWVLIKSVQSEIEIMQIAKETPAEARNFPRKIEILQPGRLARNTQLLPSNSALTLGVAHKIKDKRPTKPINTMVSKGVKSWRIELEISVLENLAPRIKSPSMVGGNKARTSDTEVR